MKKTTRILLLTLFALAVAQTDAAPGQEDASNETPPGHVCDQIYALCTSAPCVPLPEDSKRASCECRVRTGENYGTERCEERLPKLQEYSGTTVTILASTFSFDEFLTKPSMVCATGPWTNCLDKKCTVDPSDPRKARCVCDIVEKGAFFTQGGDCDRLSCANAFWSAGPISLRHLEKARRELRPLQVLAQHLRIEIPINACPANEVWLDKVFDGM